MTQTWQSALAVCWGTALIPWGWNEAPNAFHLSRGGVKTTVLCCMCSRHWCLAQRLKVQCLIANASLLFRDWFFTCLVLMWPHRGRYQKKKGCRTFLANILLLIWVLCVTDFSVFCNAKINVTEGLCDRTRKWRQRKFLFDVFPSWNFLPCWQQGQ